MANNKTRWEQESPPNVLLAIDPGASYPKSKVPYAGVALFQWGELVWGSLVKCPVEAPAFAQINELVKRVCKEAGVPRNLLAPSSRGEPITVLAVEKPRLYKRGAARPDDIMALMAIYGGFMAGVDAEFYSGPAPGEWKGSFDNDDGRIMNERTLAAMGSGERLLLMRQQQAGNGGLSEHTLDAAGIGLFVLGRMSRGGVI